MMVLMPLLSDIRWKQNQEMPSVALSLENLLGDLDLLSWFVLMYIYVYFLVFFLNIHSLKSPKFFIN